MVIMTVAMALMKNFICAWVFPVIHHTVSGVTTAAVYIVIGSAMVWMTVEMGLMRKKNTVDHQRLDLVHKMNLNVAVDIAFHSTMCVIMLMTVVTIQMKQVAI